jgi:Ubiquitin-activating enzyme E1 FCCH domain/Baseplate J-like protein
MAQLPIVMGPSGPIATPPATLRQQLLTLVSATNPGYTANLPSSLIEDVSSTDVGALIVSNQFFLDLLNSVTPYGANAFLLNYLGIDVYGIQPAQATNTAVDVIFIGDPGFVIIPGFVVGDGTYQYICTDGGVVGTNRESLPIHAIATVAGTWAVPAGTVTQLVTSVPQDITLTVVNTANGIPSIASEDETSFRTRTLVAGLASATGMDRFLKTLLWNIPGVVQRLVSVRQNITSGRWIVLVGGGDPYQVAWAIYYALFDIQTLDSPGIQVANITNSNPALVTTTNNHNLSTGMLEKFNGLQGMGPLNGQGFYVNVTGPKTATLFLDSLFATPLDTTNTTTFPQYISGGFMSPNPILQKVNLNSYPDNYVIPFIIPPQQLVTMVVTWNTDSPNYVSPDAVQQAAAPALADYINSLYVGVAPINIYNMEAVFINATVNVLPAENVTVLQFSVDFDGAGHLPTPGTGVIYGDPNSYFYTTVDNISIVQQGTITG